MTSRSLGDRAPLLWLVLPLMAGLSAANAGLPGPAALLLGGALIAATITIWAGWRAPRLWPAALLTALFLAGLASHGLHRARLRVWDALPPREAKLVLRIDRVFPRDDNRGTSGLATVVSAEPPLREVAGQKLYFLLTRKNGEAAPIRSARVLASGVIAPLPPNPPANTFDAYLAGAGMNFRFSRGRILTQVEPPRLYYRFCDGAANRFMTILGWGIADTHPALAGLLRAMMLGETHELTDEQHTLFMQSGTMHLFAISGLNIAVIAGAIQALLLLMRLPAWARFAVGTALLWLFVDITGAAPSAVRAFVMAVFLHAAFVFRRPAAPLGALVASAFLVLIVAPFQFFSASFLMSYGIVTALLVLGLPLTEAWLQAWSPWRDLPPVTWNVAQRATEAAWRWAVTAVAIGVATTLVSLVTSIQFFGLLTPGALVANLVLIPAAMLVTLAGFAALVCGLAGWAGGAILCNHASALILLVIEWLVRTAVRLPGAYLPATFIRPWIGPVALAALMLALLAGYAAHWRRERGGWWPPFVIVALALVFGVKFG
jgi:competence protein ComEC